MRNVNYINGVTGVAAGATATTDIPVGCRYHALKLFLAATIGGNPSTDPTAILATGNSVQVICDGVTIRSLSPSQIIKIAALNGITAAAGELPLYFSEPWRASVIGEESTSWPMYYNRKLTLQTTFAAGAVNPSQVVMASYDYARNVSDGKEFMAIVKQLNIQDQAPAGQYDFLLVPKVFPIQRVHFSASAGNITSVTVYRNSDKLREGTTAQNSAFLKDYKIDASQFSYPVVFDFEQQISSPLIVAQSDALDFQVTSSQANTLTALVESRAPGFI